MVRRPPQGQASTSVPKVRWCKVAQSSRRCGFFAFRLRSGMDGGVGSSLG